ncbi:MAG: MaoC family dehydratase N-terminal domain-containing protein [Rhizobiaceae bacterium]|nr:MaoC family dehydratase N-terminal domain-containing protein [Rhizobiaceae bacterium]
MNAAVENRPVDGSQVGFSRDSEEFRTSSHRLAQFARSFDDVNPKHLAGAFAPPVFAHIPVMQSMMEVLGKVAAGFVMHGEHDFVFHRTITPGQRLFTVSTLRGIRGTRAGLTFIVRSETALHDGTPVCTQYSTCLLRGAASDILHGEAVPARPAVPRTEATSDTYGLAPDQTRRYGDAARDYSPYTMDPAAAAKLGFAAPLVHGMLTLCYAGRAIVDGACGGEVARLRRLGCRFAHPLLLTPGQTVTVRRWAGEGGLVGFEAADQDGNLVIKNGYAEVSA